MRDTMIGLGPCGLERISTRIFIIFLISFFIIVVSLPTSLKLRQSKLMVYASEEQTSKRLAKHFVLLFELVC